MIGKKFVTAILCLLSFASLVADARKLSAQTETVINTRGLRESQPPHDQGAGWCAGVNPDTKLEARFTIDDPSPRAGSPVNYELLITNKGENAITLPRALNWKVVVDSDSLEQRYVMASVTLELRTQNAQTYITPTLNLYATADKTDTLLSFHPGDSLRILGTSVLPATPFGSQSGGRTTLLGHLCVSAISRNFTQSPTGRKANGGRQQMLWCTNADEKYEVNYAPER
jgi:hypothetical protein